MTVARGCALALLLAPGGCVMVDEPPAIADGDPALGGRVLPAGGDAALEAVYVVEEGDTLGAIARRFSVPGGWRALAAANHLLDPDHVEAYRGLVIPTDGLIAAGNDPFSLYDDLDLIPWRPPVDLPPEPAPANVDDEDWRPDADTRDECGGRHYHLPIQPSDLMDPDAPHCARLSTTELCVAAGPGADDADAVDQVAVTIDGRPWIALPYSFQEPLEIVEVDLDGDGDDELVISDLVGVSNGVCIEDRAMVIADRPGAPPHRYTTSGWWLAAGEPGCVLEHGSFEEIDDPVEGTGNYDVDRELIWQDGVLATRGDGIHAQRYSQVPPELRGEPLLAGQLLGRRAGTVVAFDDRPAGDRALTVAIGADRITLGQRTWAWSDDEDDPDPETQYAGLGWAGAAVLLPDDYRPPAAALLGRDATIETRLDIRTGDLSQVVWLSPTRP